LTAAAAQTPAVVKSARPALACVRDFGSIETAETHLLLAYDDVASVRFFNRPLKAWWRRSGLSFADMLDAAERGRTALATRMTAFDAGLTADLRRVGGAKYAALAALAYRQSFAACKLVADPNGQPLFFSKENASKRVHGDGRVFYPQLPHLALMSRDASARDARADSALCLGCALALRFRSARHRPVSAGRRTALRRGRAGRKGSDAGGGVRQHADLPRRALARRKQRRVRRAVVAHRHALGAEYLSKKDSIPRTSSVLIGRFRRTPRAQRQPVDQGDHGTGLLRQNGGAERRRRSIRAVYGPGESDGAQMDRGGPGGRDGTYRLAFDQPGTWSMKYNLVWDRALDFHLFPPDVAATELAFYRAAQQPYGLPLDSRKLWTKSDWLVWSATLTDRREDFEALIEPL
jgi:hypothetical protein